MKSTLFFEYAKKMVRVCEAQITTRRSAITFRGISFFLLKPYFWNDSDSESFAAEIHPYFNYLPELPEHPWVIDAGAATGHFSVPFGLIHPGSRIIAFEPSRRQRILMRRNLFINRLSKRCSIQPYGLWNEDKTLSFRTHGAISSLENVSQLAGKFLFTEKVPVVRLDDWIAKHRPPRINLIKMDIEGAEIEAIEGMKDTLTRYKPSLLIQAYHVREGARTLERCMDLLSSYGYAGHEVDATGLLVAKPA